MVDCTQFLAWAAARGVLIDPARCVADGKIHRADAGERESDRADASYLLWPDGDGWIRNFKVGGGIQYFRRKDHGMQSPPISAGGRVKLRRLQAERAARRAAEHERAVASARAQWARAAGFGHRYLSDPPLPPAGLRVSEGKLLVPVLGFDERGQPTWRGLQVIDEDGTKKFAPGTRSHGAFAIVPCTADPLLAARTLRSARSSPPAQPGFIVCEGAGTALALYEITRLPIVAALSAGNLPVLAQALRAARQRGFSVTDNVVIYADADDRVKRLKGAVRQDQDFIGQRMAVEAARILGPSARVAIPARPVGVTPPGYDARDQLREGLELSVLAAIAGALPPDLIRLPWHLAGQCHQSNIVPPAGVPAGASPRSGARDEENEMEIEDGVSH